jgi:cobalt-zinc-cadmium efflux system outer membrane protein
MFRKSLFIATLAAAISSSARAQVPVQDAALRKLLDEAAGASPEVAQAQAGVEAERARIPQAGALSDPSLTLGIQNDGFKRIAIGTAETSFINIMVTQPLYWPGKRGLREQVATIGARRAEALLARASLDLEGRVRRAYLGWLFALGQVELLAEQELLWTQAEQTARSRYEAGQAPQSDLLRAQLERARLQQRRWALDSEVAIRLAELNRLRARPLDERVLAAARLAETADPALLSERDAMSDAEARSPELLFLSLGVDQAGRRVELARKEELPDFAVTAAIMPRGGLEPMWSLGVTVGLPIFAGRKQDRAVDENQQRQIGEQQGAEALRQILRLRAHERVGTLAAMNRTNQLYRSQILVLSSATTRSTLAQYEVGRVSFASVLEALAGYVSDRASFLGSLAEAQLVAIAHQEVSLESVSSGGVGSSGGMPVARAAGMSASAPSAGTQTSSAAEPTSSRSTTGM